MTPSDELAKRRAMREEPLPDPYDLLRSMDQTNGRLAAELKRLGDGIVELRDEWAQDCHLGFAAARLDALLRRP